MWGHYQHDEAVVVIQLIIIASLFIDYMIPLDNDVRLEDTTYIVH